MKRYKWVLLLISLGFMMYLQGCNEENQLEMDWPETTNTTRPWTRWWWLGNAVNKTDLSRCLQAYAEVGFGGVEITPIYGVKGKEEQFIDFLSPEWMEMLRFTCDKARQLDMQVDMATGTGWPFGGPQVTKANAAHKITTRTWHLKTRESITEPIILENEHLNTIAPLHVLMAYSGNDQVLDLTTRIDQNGRLNWQAPEGAWTVIAVFNDWTGQQVKRAAPGGEGHVMDHFSREALNQYLARFDSAFARVSPGLIRCYFNDSFEVYGSNWTGDLFREFEKRRGYKLEQYLPTLLAKVRTELSKRVRADYHETISDLLLQEFTLTWREWAHNKNSRVRNQAHGSPGNWLDLYAMVDIPETETIFPSEFDIPGYPIYPKFADRVDQPDPLLLKFASSACHVTGKTLTSSESATWLGEHFKVALWHVKPQMDQLFISGINHILFHGTPYSPADADWPGWLFYASTHFAPTNTFWRDLPALTGYINRCQSFLQSAKPANDILVYFPIYDIWHHAGEFFLPLSLHNPNDWFYDTPLHRVADELWNTGYTFDYISDRQILQLNGSDNKIKSGSNQYKTILLPSCDYLPIRTLKKLIQLARDGATVIVDNNMPTTVPGLGGLDKRRTEFMQLLAEIKFQNPTRSNFKLAKMGNGQFLLGDDLKSMLGFQKIEPEPLKKAGLDFIRLNASDGYIYFVTNLSAQPVRDWIPLTHQARSVMLFDPVSSRKGLAALQNGKVFLDLQAGESLILRTLNHQIKSEPWHYLQKHSTHEIKGTWTIQFIKGGPVLPKDIRTTKLKSWTELGGSETKRFSGTAVYRIEFNAPDIEPDTWILDLGRIGSSARVRVNGTFSGTVWCYPFHKNIGKVIKPETNTLEIEVTNLMANRIADMDRRGIEWKTFYDINLVNILYEPFDASEWIPVESGLLEPVKLIACDLISK